LDLYEHHGAELASLNSADASLSQPAGKDIHQRRGDVRWRCLHETWAASLAAVGIKRELRDNQGLSIPIKDREIGLATSIRKDAQMGDFVRQAYGLSLSVTMTSAQEDDQTKAYLPYDLALHSNTAFANTLDDSSHIAGAPLDLEMCFALF
jgi:hypothetical protein